MQCYISMGSQKSKNHKFKTQWAGRTWFSYTPTVLQCTQGFDFPQPAGTSHLLWSWSPDQEGVAAEMVAWSRPRGSQTNILAMILSLQLWHWGSCSNDRTLRVLLSAGWLGFSVYLMGKMDRTYMDRNYKDISTGSAWHFHAYHCLVLTNSHFFHKQTCKKQPEWILLWKNSDFLERGGVCSSLFFSEHKHRTKLMGVCRWKSWNQN